MPGQKGEDGKDGPNIVNEVVINTNPVSPFPFPYQ
jgi:hypothetical protein